MKVTEFLPLFFLLLACVLAAPHLAWPDARIAALVCIAAALAFGIINEVIG